MDQKQLRRLAAAFESPATFTFTSVEGCLGQHEDLFVIDVDEARALIAKAEEYADLVRSESV